MTILDERAVALWIPLLAVTLSKVMGKSMTDALKAQQKETALAEKGDAA